MQTDPKSNKLILILLGSGDVSLIIILIMSAPPLHGAEDGVADDDVIQEERNTSDGDADDSSVAEGSGLGDPAT